MTQRALHHIPGPNPVPTKAIARMVTTQTSFVFPPFSAPGPGFYRAIPGPVATAMVLHLSKILGMVALRRNAIKKPRKGSLQGFL